MSTLSSLQLDLARRQQDVRAAEKAVEAAVREEWKQKARDLAKDARAAKAAFLKAKGQYAECTHQLERLDVKKKEIEVDIETLEENFRALEIPLAEEEKEYQNEKQKLYDRIAKVRQDIGLVQVRRGQAWQDEISTGQHYATLAHAYSNAKALAGGRKLGVIEGGIAAV